MREGRVSAGPDVRERLADALSGHGGAEAVRWALRAPAPRALLRRQVAAILTPGQPLGSCRLRRAKFKPGRRLNAWYDVDLGAAGRRSIAITWEDPPPSPDWPAADAMEAEAAAAGLAAPFTRLRSTVPELGLRVLVAPLDPAFGNLVRLSDPLRIPELIAGAPIDAPGSNGRWTVTAVRYRPGQRHVLRWEQDDRQRQPVFAKLYRRNASAQAFRLANQVADWLERTGEPVAGARPLAHLPEVDVLLYPFVPGRQLAAGLGSAASGGVLAGRLVRAGTILRALHGAPAELADGLPTRGFDDFAGEVHKAAAHIRFLVPAAGARLEEVLGRARELHERLPGEAHVFTHADYKADHLLATPDRLTVIDFDTCALADPALDLGKLVADLRFWSLRGRAVDPDGARARLLDGYGPTSRPRLLRARLYEVLMLAKLAVRRVSVADPDWAQRTTELFERCAGLLDDLEREVVA
jgi:aminoglycoside phosphotransferase (APT) family kinase protein